MVRLHGSGLVYKVPLLNNNMQVIVSSVTKCDEPGKTIMMESLVR